MDDEREPWWQVTGVFDPDGTGSDFAYTVGLASGGLPELHLWARPSIGDDPGLDWKFSVNDTCRILNEQAWRLVDGRLGVGDRWETQYDEGFVTARFSVGEPVDAAEVDAFGVGDGPVLPIRWELDRPPVGPPRPMEPGLEASSARAYDEIVAGLAVDADPPAGWALPDEPTWEADQVFGPRTPLVLARAAELRLADGESIADAVDVAMLVSEWGSPGHAILVARAAARERGRSGALERLEAAARELMADFGVAWGVDAHGTSRDWMLGGVPASEHDGLWGFATDQLTTAVTALLTVEAVADLVPPRVVTFGQGAVRTTLAPSGYPPDDTWRCSAAVEAAVRRLVGATAPGPLVAASIEWEAVSRDEAHWGLASLRHTTASYPPIVVDLIDRDAGVAVQALLAAEGCRLVVLQTWLHDLATLLSHRALVDPAIVDAFLACGRGIDGLGELVNTPLTEGAAP